MGKRKVGKPRLFETPEDLQNAINKYLEDTPIEEYTVTGLALSLGTSRNVLDEYQKRPEHKATVTEAKLIIENSYELALRKNGRAGEIFGLKNFGWSDKQTLEHTTIDDDGEPKGFNFVEPTKQNEPT